MQHVVLLAEDRRCPVEGTYEQVLKVLKARTDCFNDEILVQQVRLQILLDKTVQSTTYDGVIIFVEHTGELFPLFPVGIHSQLRDFKIEPKSQPQTDGKSELISWHGRDDEGIDLAVSDLAIQLPDEQD